MPRSSARVKGQVAAATALGVAALGLILAPSSSASAPLTRATTSQPQSLTDLILGLPAVPAVLTGYPDARFSSPSADRLDRRGCGTRERVLLASARTKPAIRPGCRLVSGTWSVDGGARIAHGSKGVVVVPLVSTQSLWGQGAFGWSNAQRRAVERWRLAPDQECALGPAAPTSPTCQYILRSRDRSGLTTPLSDVMSQPAWRPTCDEILSIALTMTSWGLSLDPAPRRAMLSTAPTCGRVVAKTHVLNDLNPIAPRFLANRYAAAQGASPTLRPREILDPSPGPLIGGELFGLHVPHVDGPPPEVAYEWVRLWDAKTGWEPLEQTRGRYYWKWLDEAVAFAESRGTKVQYVFGDTPPWAGPTSTRPPTDLDDFRRYVDAVIDRYGSRIAAYEVWNEPFFAGANDVSPDVVLDMTTIVHDRVKVAGLASRVLTPGTTLRTGAIAYQYYTNYLSRLAERDWPVDGFALHSYPKAEGTPAARALLVAQFTALLALARAPDLPVYDTEVNYGLGGNLEARRPITGPDAQGYLAQTFIDAVRFGLSTVAWYLWFPHEYPLLGIQLDPQSPQTIRAWQWAHDQLVGSTWHGCAQSGAVVSCGLSRNGQPFALAYSSTGEVTAVDVPATLRTACDMDGTCWPIADDLVIVGIRPVVIR